MRKLAVVVAVLAAATIVFYIVTGGNGCPTKGYSIDYAPGAGFDTPEQVIDNAFPGERPTMQRRVVMEGQHVTFEKREGTKLLAIYHVTTQTTQDKWVLDSVEACP